MGGNTLPNSERLNRSFLSSYEKLANKFTQAGLSETVLEKIQTAINGEQFNYKPLKIDGRTYHLGFDQKKREIELVVLGKIIASGTFSDVRKLTQVLDNTTEAFKQATSDISKEEKAKKALSNEFHLLTSIHKVGKVWGIQAPPRKMTQIQEGLTEQFGYFGKLYEGDYFDDIDENPSRKFKDYLVDFHQLLMGLKHLSDLNILHGDLKPENILIKLDDDGIKLVHLADFGGAVMFDPTLSLDQIAGARGRTFTSAFSPYCDLEKSIALAAQGKYDELVELEKKRDIFSMGCILQKLITNKDAYDLDDLEFPRLDTYHSINDQDVPGLIKDLIKRMVDPDYTKRPTAQNAFEIFNEYFQSSHITLYNQINEKIKKEYPGSIASNSNR
jgi:serine/threonine protein kinase